MVIRIAILKRSGIRSYQPSNKKRRMNDESSHAALIEESRALKRRARDSNPQPLTGHFISNEAASHSLTLRRQPAEIRGFPRFRRRRSIADNRRLAKIVQLFLKSPPLLFAEITSYSDRFAWKGPNRELLQ